MSSNHCLIRHGSLSTNRHRCRTRCAGRSQMPAAPRRATISTVTAIAVITAARRSRRSKGPCRGRGGFADAGRPCGTVWHCQPPRARRLATDGPPVTAGPPDYQPLARPRPPPARRIAKQCLPPVGRRRPAQIERRSPLMPPPLAGRSQTIARASAVMQPLQPSTVHDDSFHE